MLSGALFQSTQRVERVMSVMPMMPPTQECVVDTGSSRYEASTSQMATAMMTQVMP